jgi:hypothetical protein
MRVYDGLFNPEFGIARGYQCPAVAKDGKPASRVKDKFVKEWGPAAQMQLERDKAENRQTFEGVKILSELFESYNQLCADDAETKKKEKEKDQLTKAHMTAPRESSTLLSQAPIAWREFHQL